MTHLHSGCSVDSVNLVGTVGHSLASPQLGAAPRATLQSSTHRFPVPATVPTPHRLAAVPRGLPTFSFGSPQVLLSRVSPAIEMLAPRSNSVELSRAIHAPCEAVAPSLAEMYRAG